MRLTGDLSSTDAIKSDKTRLLGLLPCLEERVECS